MCDALLTRGMSDYDTVCRWLKIILVLSMIGMTGKWNPWGMSDQIVRFISPLQDEGARDPKPGGYSFSLSPCKIGRIF